MRITNRGKPVGVLVAPQEYNRLRQAQAYLDLVDLAHTLRESGVTAGGLFRVGRDGLDRRVRDYPDS